MKKRLLIVVALVAIIVIAALTLTACNKFKWGKIDGGDPSAASVSNGGYVVEQGDYVYFINGYIGSVDSNDWGAAYKQSIMRCKKNADGTYDNSTATVVVPKSIYYNSAKAGFAIFGNFIYYATPNLEKDKTGAASTTHTDFMRTSLDGTLTQRIATLNSRTNDFMFTPTRILYFDGTTLKYIDFSKMSTKKSTNNGNGATAGTLIENASTYFWAYDAEYTAGQGASIADYIFYTKAVNNSYEKYNELKAIRYDGSDEKTLATFSTYLTEAEVAQGYTNFPEKVFTFSLKNAVVESDSQITLYYTKAVQIGNSSTVIGTFQNKVTLEAGFVPANEKAISTQDISEVVGISYDKGCLYGSDSKYYYFNGTDSNLAIGKSVTLLTTLTVENSTYVYYTDSDKEKVYRVNLTAADNETVILEDCIADATYAADFVGSKYFYFGEDEYSYIHYVDLSKYNGEELKATLLGKFNSEDQAKYDEEHKDED